MPGPPVLLRIALPGPSALPTALRSCSCLSHRPAGHPVLSLAHLRPSPSDSHSSRVCRGMIKYPSSPNDTPKISTLQVLLSIVNVLLILYIPRHRAARGVHKLRLEVTVRNWHPYNFQTLPLSASSS